MFFKPDRSDPRKVRRNLAIFSVWYFFLVAPVGLIVLSYHGLSEANVAAFLTYCAVLATAGIVPYAVSCYQKDKKGGDDASGNS